MIFLRLAIQFVDIVEKFNIIWTQNMVFIRLAMQLVDVVEEFCMDIEHDIPTTCHAIC